jgi:thiamine monophosphate synthase
VVTTIEEIWQHATKWLWTYNHEKPTVGIGGIAPKQKQVLVAYPLLFISIKNGGYYNP